MSPGELCQGPLPNGERNVDRCPGYYDLFRWNCGVKYCYFEPVDENECPCTDSDRSGCDLSDCTSSTLPGELCEADRKLPDGQLEYRINNCWGSDVFRRNCEGSQICPSGTKKVGESCKVCPTGKYQDSTGQSSCKECSTGTYQDSTRQSSCKNCPTGKYTYWTGAADFCNSCWIGKYQDETGQGTCKTCPSGYTNEHQGSVECLIKVLNCAPFHFPDRAITVDRDYHPSYSDFGGCREGEIYTAGVYCGVTCESGYKDSRDRTNRYGQKEVTVYCDPQQDGDEVRVHLD
eukprot:UN23865